MMVLGKQFALCLVQDKAAKQAQLANIFLQLSYKRQKFSSTGVQTINEHFLKKNESGVGLGAANFMWKLRMLDTSQVHHKHLSALHLIWLKLIFWSYVSCFHQVCFQRRSV